MKTKFLVSGNLIVILAFLFVLFGPGAVMATPITFNAQVISSGPTANVEIYNDGGGSIFYSGDVYTDYSLSTNLWGVIDAFCVENAYASNSSQQYELLSVPNTDKFQHAAWIADQYWNGWAYSKTNTQIAIWRVVLGTLFVHNSGGNKSEIQNIVELQWNSPIANVSFAQNPPGGQEKGYQDYLVNIPEPATMLLFGTGLIGLAGLGRRKFRRN